MASAIDLDLLREWRVAAPIHWKHPKPETVHLWEFVGTALLHCRAVSVVLIYSQALRAQSHSALAMLLPRLSA
jgi:hypothetical protein